MPLITAGVTYSLSFRTRGQCSVELEFFRLLVPMRDETSVSDGAERCETKGIADTIKRTKSCREQDGIVGVDLVFLLCKSVMHSIPHGLCAFHNLGREHGFVFRGEIGHVEALQ